MTFLAIYGACWLIKGLLSKTPRDVIRLACPLARLDSKDVNCQRVRCPVCLPLSEIAQGLYRAPEIIFEDGFADGIRQEVIRPLPVARVLRKRSL